MADSKQVFPIVGGSVRALPDLSRIGGKASGVFRAVDLGFNIPESVVIGADAYRTAKELAFGAGKIPLDEFDLSDVRSFMLSSQLDWATVGAVSQWCAMLRERNSINIKFAVRSSATVEDALDRSFAGVFDSVLGASTNPEIVSAICQCWASVWTKRSAAYCQVFGIDLFSIDMAVLIQRFVPTRFGGVAFTCDPRSMEMDRVVIEVLESDCSLVVGGLKTPNLYVLRDESALPSTCSPEEGAALKWVREIALKARQSELGHWEIEWIVGEDEVGYVLQLRPVTTRRRRDGSEQR